MCPVFLLTLFDMREGGGGMMAPQNVFDHCAQTRRRRKLKLGDFLILIYGASKKLFLVP